jgi:ATP-dependent Lon protease
VDTLGLFPLGLVLFPGSMLPLHIFEPRYRILVNTAIEKRSHFGINLVETSKLFEVGCSASVNKVSQRYADGRFDVVVKGEKRFHLHTLTESSSSYFVGSVEFFEDIPEDLDTELLFECKEKYIQIIEQVYPERLEKLDYTSLLSSESPSFFMAQKSGLSLLQKQELLEMRSENSRLQFLIDHLSEILPEIKQQENTYRIIVSDGYLPLPPPTPDSK